MSVPKRKRDSNGAPRRDTLLPTREGEETLYINSNKKKLKVYKSDKKSRKSVESKPDEDVPTDASPLSESEEPEVAASPVPPRKPTRPAASPSASPPPEKVSKRKSTAIEPATPDQDDSNPFLREKTKRRRRGSDGGGLVGHFTPDEVSALEKFKVSFCNTYGIRGPTFDTMVQHSAREKETFPSEAGITKPEFWRAIYSVHPKRDKRSVYRFMRRHFQDSQQKPHAWTPLQDQELIELHEKYGPKFAYIAKLLGRSDDDVVQRWKNRLQHRNTMRSGPWSQEESTRLLEILQDAYTQFKAEGKVEASKDVYEMDWGMVQWGYVSRDMGFTRSRQQCADKWRKVRGKVLEKRRYGQPDAVYDPASETRPSARRARSQSHPQGATPDKNYKSSEYVDESDEDEAKPDDKTADGSTPSKKQASPRDAAPKTPTSKSKSSEAPQVDETPQETEELSEPSPTPTKTHAVEPPKNDTDSDDDSSDDSESSASSDNDSDSSSESEESDDEEGKQSKPVQSTPPLKPERTSPVETSSSDSESSSSSEDDSSTDSPSDSDSSSDSDEDEDDVKPPTDEQKIKRRSPSLPNPTASNRNFASRNIKMEPDDFFSNSD
ncbi:hypothetical protein BDV59DRAFT_147598 [Aspergillus ambiguus]|uniref:MYB DNA-binding domain protein n=1 Tax=Aspergillus ambiguus TaxID=176160 RepID=UPI003CCCD807